MDEISSALFGTDAPADAAATAADAAVAVDATKPDGKAADAVDTKPGEAKPDAKADGEAKDAKADDKPAGAPEAYTDFKVPDGFEMDSALLAEFTPTLKALNLTQDQAQQVMDFAPKFAQATAEKTASAVLDAVGLADRAEWTAQVKADKELGGEKVAEHLAVAKKAFDAFGSPELKVYLGKTGLGNHPELIRAFYRAGKQISEDGFVMGGKQTTTKSPYDKSTMNP